jgi:hypothetical protein
MDPKSVPRKIYPKLRNCSFKFECNQMWDNLIETKSRKIRHCTKCDEDVHLIEDGWDLTRAINANYCVAIPRIAIIHANAMRKHNLGQLSYKLNEDKL